MKTRKTKIIVAVVLFLVCIVTSVLLTMKFNKISYMMNINKPDNIIVYYNSQSNNKVFSPKDKEYENIYSLIVNGSKQSVLSAMFNGELSNNVYVEKVDSSEIKFNTIIINFCYNKPQVVQLKNNDYLDNGRNYWYQNLIFTLDSNNNFKYNTVAIVVPESSVDFVSPFTYSLKYNVYSNWNKCYSFAKNLF